MRAPLPLLVVAVALTVIALATDHPLVVAAAVVAAGALYTAAPAPRGPFLRLAIISGLILMILNPLIALEGDRVLIPGPGFGPFDLEVTAEELLYGLIAGLRLVALILATSAFLLLSDPDRVQALASRVAPRSALTVALAARLMPTLRRDAIALSESLRLRGFGPGVGRRARIRSGAALVEPLIGSSLERGVDIAEAMAARGYGGATPTPLPQPRLRPPEWFVLGIGLLLAAVAAIVITGSTAYRTYPVADPVVIPTALGVAAVTALGGIACALLLRPDRST
jgi:energy-coupling factor transporter transmembrane protein EcfT